MVKLTLRAVEYVVGDPPSLWMGRCYEIACAVVKAGLVRGHAVYGHYLGPVAPNTMFYRPSLPFVQHGWIETKTRRIDPTRWVFFGIKPYIFDEPIARYREQYDEGGNQWRSSMLSPPPLDSEGGQRVRLDIRPKFGATWMRIETLFGGLIDDVGDMSIEQANWLANQHYDALQPYAAVIYKALEAAGYIALVPLDNRMRAERTTDTPRSTPASRRRLCPNH